MKKYIDYNGNIIIFDGKEFYPSLELNRDNEGDEAFWLWVNYCLKTCK